MKYLHQKPSDKSYRDLGPSILEVVFDDGHATRESALLVVASGKHEEHSRTAKAKMEACSKAGIALDGDFYFTVDNIAEVIPGKKFVVTITVYVK